MDQVPCAICGGSQTKWLFDKKASGNNYSIVACRSCNLVYVNPQPNESELEEFYSDEFDYSYMLALDKHTVGEARLELSHLLKHVKNGRLLDVGCGIGIFLSQACQYFDVEGTELSQTCADFARERFALTVHSGDLIELKLPGESFDVVTMYHVLEHLPKPRRYLAEVWRLLKPGGLLVLVVPNVAGWQFRLLGKWWEWVTPPKHLYYYSSETLGRLLTDQSFVMTETLTRPRTAHDPILSVGLSLLGRLDLSQAITTHLFRRNMPSTKGFRFYQTVREVTSVLSIPFYPLEWTLARAGRGPWLEIYARKKG